MIMIPPTSSARKAERAEAAFWRSAVWLPAEAARAADRPAGIGPTDATLPIHPAHRMAAALGGGGEFASLSSANPRQGRALPSHARGRVAARAAPRVRGTALLHRRRDRRSRFIPACAGNRSAGNLCMFSMAVHPRVCGEQSSGWGTPGSSSGSSPRVRGTGCTVLLSVS